MVHGIADGLLNLVFHPKFPENGRLFVFYSYELATDIDDEGTDLFSLNLTEFRVSRENRNKVDYDSERLVFSLAYKKFYEEIPDLTGGALFFKDGYLFLAIGDTEEAEGAELLARNL